MRKPLRPRATKPLPNLPQPKPLLLSDLTDVWLVAGIGNPGERYSATPHNAGARVVERLAASHDARFKAAKARAVVAETSSGGARLLIARPTTFMNESGQAVAPLMRYYKVEPHHLIVVHDEIDLPAGALRVKFGGSNAGHHGLDSISGSLSTSDYYRVRVGVGRPSHPSVEPADYVLARPSRQVASAITEAEEQALDAVETLIADGLDEAKRKYHGRRDSSAPAE